MPGELILEERMVECLRLVVVTSPATDAGKTFLAVGIAEAAAQRELKVLFVELDVAVGDALRVFGLADAARTPHPTVATWAEYPDLSGACLKSSSGVCVLPRPELSAKPVSGDSIEDLLSAAESGFDLAVADLGVDCYVEYWAVAVKRASTAILVSDCDEKALVRVKHFLESCCPADPPGGWVLAVNAREKKSAYTPKDVMRFLARREGVCRIVYVPHFPNTEKAAVKAFPPDSQFAEDILKVVLEGNCSAAVREFRKGEKVRLGFSFLGKLLKRKRDGDRAGTLAEAPPFSQEIFNTAEKAAQSPLDGGGVFSENTSFHVQVEAEATPAIDPVSEVETHPTKRGIKGTLLLLGPQSWSLADEMVALGWEVTKNPSEQADVAVVDADLLPADELKCPRLGFSRKISNFFQTDTGTDIVVTNRAVIPSLLEQYARKRSIPVQQPPTASMGIKGPGKFVKATTAEVQEKKGIIYAFYSGAQGSQGKTVIAVNLGALLAGRGKKVCVVDFDTDKAGLTLLLGYSDESLPAADLAGCIEERSIKVVKGLAGMSILPAPIFTKNPGWFPTSEEVRWLITALAGQYDYVLLDFGAKLASPPVLDALKMSDQVFIVSTPMRTALSAIARFRGRELMEVGNDKITAVINRVGVRGGLTPRDAARLLGFKDYCEVPEDPAVAEAENDAIGNKAYHPPALRRKSLIGPALLKISEVAERRVRGS